MQAKQMCQPERKALHELRAAARLNLKQRVEAILRPTVLHKAVESPVTIDQHTHVNHPTAGKVPITNPAAITTTIEATATTPANPEAPATTTKVLPGAITLATARITTEVTARVHPDHPAIHLRALQAVHGAAVIHPAVLQRAVIRPADHLDRLTAVAAAPEAVVHPLLHRAVPPLQATQEAVHAEGDKEKRRNYKMRY
jgi:hypothetical protein